MGATATETIAALRDGTTLAIGRQVMVRALEGGARLRIALAGWPHHVDAGTRAYLARLPWRWRRAVILVYGLGRTQEQAARELCVSRATVGRDLDRAVELYG